VDGFHGPREMRIAAGRILLLVEDGKCSLVAAKKVAAYKNGSLEAWAAAGCMRCAAFWLQRVEHCMGVSARMHRSPSLWQDCNKARARQPGTQIPLQARVDLTHPDSVNRSGSALNMDGPRGSWMSHEPVSVNMPSSQLGGICVLDIGTGITRLGV
jgi:hypothetical protein